MQFDARERFSDLSRWAQKTNPRHISLPRRELTGNSERIRIPEPTRPDDRGGLPNDLVWILQVVQSISAGFIVVKILFDDIPERNS